MKNLLTGILCIALVIVGFIVIWKLIVPFLGSLISGLLGGLIGIL